MAFPFAFGLLLALALVILHFLAAGCAKAAASAPPSASALLPWGHVRAQQVKRASPVYLALAGIRSPLSRPSSWRSLCGKSSVLSPGLPSLKA